MRAGWRACGRAAAALYLLAPAASRAQSLNVDFGIAGSAPAGAYAAAGAAGEWNAVDVLPPGQRQPLVGPDGAPLPANIYMIGGTGMLSANDPATTADDEALLDDMLIGFNDPVDVCVWVENLVNGQYEVVTYAMTPGDASLLSRVRVDFAVPGPVLVGGAWPGGHAEGVTYARHVVTVTDGKIGLHSGLPSGFIQSGINGVQITLIAATSVGTSGALGPPPPAALAIERVYPNPARGRQVIELRVGGAASGALAVFDASGRLVWDVPLAGLAPGLRSIAWDGRDLSGTRVAPSVYFARVIQRSSRFANPAGAIGAPARKLTRID